MQFVRILILCVISVSFFACWDDEIEETFTGIENQEGLFVLCEGAMGHNNSSLDFLSFGDNTTMKNIYASINSQGLGETANAMIKLQNELWIVVNGSAMISIVNASNGKIAKIIPIVDENGRNRSPRNLVHHNGFVYVSCFDGNVVKISEKSKNVVGVLQTEGRNPEGIAVVGNRIYVANSGGLSYPNYDNTVSVIDLENFAIEKMIVVKDNPQRIKAYDNRVYVVSTGDYTTDYRMTIIENGEKVDSIDINAMDFAFNNGNMYYIDFKFGSNKIGLKKLGVSNLHAEPKDFAQIPSNLINPYRISIIDNIIYVTDAKNFTVSGEAFAFNENGVLLYSFPTSIGPNTIIKK